MNFPKLLRMFPALTIISCAAPKAIVVQEGASEPIPKSPPTLAQDENAQPDLPDLQNDGLRLPDLLELPGDEQFRTDVPGKPTPGGGAVISRPPTDPPSRPKPDDAKPPGNP